MKAPKGTLDILPEDSWRWQRLEQVLREASRSSGFREIRTPIFEHAELFLRAVGESTDAVGKEMYHWVDQGNDHLALRPELTACVARAVHQHNLLAREGTLRLWYAGPMFRRERPQKGRYRQFHQYGAELLGSTSPESDVECILLADRILREIGLSEFVLDLNSLGSAGSRLAYRSALVEFLEPYRDELSEDSRRRLESNPLRILDTKNEHERNILQDAPLLDAYLDDASRQHFDRVQELLTNLGVDFRLSPALVRGLDYYCHTAFEFVTTRLGAQGQIGGGGRYDGLAEQFGGKPFAGVGFAFGLERMLMLLEEEGKTIGNVPAVDVYIVGIEEADRQAALRLAVELRKHNYAVISDLQGRSFKAQMREANKLQAAFTIIIGEKERLENRYTLKAMTSGEQESVAPDAIAAFLQARSG